MFFSEIDLLKVKMQEELVGGVDKFIIVDYISCINPKRHKSEIEKLQPYNIRYNNWKVIQKSLKLENIIHKNFSYIK